MSDHSFTVRLDMGYEDEKQAWDKLKRLQRKTHLSYNRIVTDAVNAYDASCSEGRSTAYPEDDGCCG